MISIRRVTNADYYLGGGSGCGQHTHRPAGDAGPAEYELQAAAAGEPPGEWVTRGENPLGVSGTIVAEAASGDAFRTLLNTLRDPRTGEELGERPRRFKNADERLAAWLEKHPHATPEEVAEERVQAQKPKPSAVHGYDLTFSLPKSWSVLHAALQREGRHGDADLMWAAARKGIEAALDQAAEELGYTRHGAGGPKIAGRATTRFARNTNFTMALWRHHTSRERDPQLHAHVLILNRVLCADGRWRALHGTPLYQNKHMLDATFLRTAEAELTRTLGVRYATRPDGKAREIVGVDADVRDLFSARTRALTGEAQQLVDAFTARYGRAPSALLAWRMNQRATLSTRRAKTKTPPTRVQDLDSWEQAMAGEFRDGLSSVVAAVDGECADPDHPLVVPALDAAAVIEQALADLEQRKATWTRSHLYHAISMRAPDMLAAEPEDVRALLTELTDAALRSRSVVAVEVPSVVEVPTALRDPRTGRSVFEAPEGERYTTCTHLEREDALVARLDQAGATRLPHGTAVATVSGRGLSGDQRQAAVDILTSGRRLELVDKPAGAGGSRLVGALSDLEVEATGRGVTGFTTAQIAAEVLGREGVGSAHNIAAYLDFRVRLADGEVSEVERATFTVGRRVVVDEASMVDTATMARLLRELDTVGVEQVILVGDTGQVDAVDAGGGFAMLVRERDRAARDADLAAEGSAAGVARVRRLAEVRRFRHRWERAASARVRDGDVEALAQYDARGRLRGDTDPDVVVDMAVAGFVTDHMSGLDSIVVVASTEQAADVSSRVRHRLVDAGQVEAGGVRLHDENTAGVGDMIQTRKNDRGLGVVNRDRWEVVGASSRGDLEVRQLVGRDASGCVAWGSPRSLPAAYVAEHVELAYAGTVEAVEGVTTDTGHMVADRWTGRSRLYPGTTRGVHRNHLYLVLDDSHVGELTRARDRVAMLERRLDGLVGDTNRGLLERQLAAARVEVARVEAQQETPLGRAADIVGNDDHCQAARTAIAAEQDRARHLGHLGPQWRQLVTEDRGVEHRRVVRRALGDEADLVLGDEAAGNLLHLLRCAEMSGHPVLALLDDAMTRHGSLAGARAPAAALYARVDDLIRRTPIGPERVGLTYESRTVQAPRTPEGLYALRLSRAMDDRCAELGRLAEQDPPRWAVDWFGPAPEGWRMAMVLAYREEFGWTSQRHPIGPSPTRANPERLWAWRRAAGMLGIGPREQELGQLSRGELRNRVQCWEREQSWMPRNVDDDLRAAHLALEEARTQLVETRTAERDTDGLDADVLALEVEVAGWERAAEVRARAVEATTESRDRAVEAGGELRRRELADRERAADERPAPAEPEREEDREPEPADPAAASVLRVREPVGPDRLAAVLGHAERYRVVDREVPEFGSREWCGLPDGDPVKRAAVEGAAVSWWRVGEPLSRDEIESVSARVAAAEEELGRGEELDGVAALRVRPRAADPRVDDDQPDTEVVLAVSWSRDQHADDVDADQLAAVHAYARPHLTRAEPAPEFGSREWAALDVDDPARESASVAAALAEWNVGDTPLSRLQARAEAAEDKVSAAAISRVVQEQRAEHPDDRTHAAVVRARAEVEVQHAVERGDEVWEQEARGRVDDARDREEQQQWALAASELGDDAAAEPMDRSRFAWAREAASQAVPDVSVPAQRRVEVVEREPAEPEAAVEPAAGVQRGRAERLAEDLERANRAAAVLADRADLDRLSADTDRGNAERGQQERVEDQDHAGAR